MFYFNKFPTVLYDPQGTGSAKLATNILKRVQVRTNMAKEYSLLDPYDVQDGETPEILVWKTCVHETDEQLFGKLTNNCLEN